MKANTMKEIYSWIKLITFAFIIVFICRQFIFTPITVFGESMLPTFETKDKVIVSKTTEIQRFDLIVFNAPDVEGAKYIKRVIGLPGDRIIMKDDRLYINGKQIKEPYLIENKNNHPLNKLTGDFSLEEKTGKETVPKNMLFVMGDNRLKSKDSRIFGFIPYDSVLGEVKFQFYPFKDIGVPK